MVIVDTTAWIDFFQDRRTPEVSRLEALLNDDTDIFVTGVIVQEILSGIKNGQERRQTRQALERFLVIMPTLETHAQAAEIYDLCLKKGFTIRSSIDCLFAALALEYDLSLLARDRDYVHIAKVFPLKTCRV